MPITDLERSEIKMAAEFLEKLGYIRAEDQYSIDYSLNDICISIVYPTNSEESNVNIRFIKKNQFFDIGWMAFVRNDIKGSNNKLMNVKELLKYVENHYLQIKDYQYCVESDYLVDKYVEEHREIFESAISKFLNRS